MKHDKIMYFFHVGYVMKERSSCMFHNTNDFSGVTVTAPKAVVYLVQISKHR